MLAGVRGTIGRAGAVVLLACTFPAAASACGGCGDVNCGSGVLVWWSPGDIPEVPGHRLCIDGDCELRDPAPVGSDGALLSVAPSTAHGTSEPSVRLDLLDDQGAITATYTGSGTKSGDCCPGLSLHPTAAGALEPESPW
jgi:hypothetical protein